MEIRKAKKEDIEGILQLQKSYNEKYWKKEDFEKSIKNKDAIFFIAEENDKIVGSVIGFITPTKRTDSILHETRVNKKEKGNGIGTKLVNEFCKESFKIGAKDVYALISKKHIPFYVKSCKFKKESNWIEIKKSK